MDIINVKIEGYSIERFMNKCVNNKFYSGYKKRKSTIAYMNVGMKDFETLCNFAPRYSVPNTSSAQKRLPFVLQKYKKRKIFFITILLIILCLDCFIKICMEYSNRRIEQDKRSRKLVNY